VVFAMLSRYRQLPPQVPASFLPAPLAQQLIDPGLADAFSPLRFTFCDGVLPSYYDWKGEERFVGRDARKLIILGIYGDAYGDSGSGRIGPLDEGYLCLDLDNDGCLILIRPFHQDLWFVNRSLALFNRCVAVLNAFYKEISDHGEEEFVENGILTSVDVPEMDSVAGRWAFACRLRCALEDVDFDAVGAHRVYPEETDKFWNGAADEIFDAMYL